MKKLLIVDDEAEILEFLKEFFEEKGFAVFTAGSKEEARGILSKEQPHVALLDIRMRTDRDGIEILTWIKQQQLGTRTIMVTAVESRDIVDEAGKLGADDYITKPLSLEYLYSSVTAKIEKLIQPDF